MEEMIAVAVIIGLIPAVIAKNKGREFLLWWLFGAAMWIIAFPMSLMLKDQSGKQCPKCKEYVDKNAVICKHCKSEL